MAPHTEPVEAASSVNVRVVATNDGRASGCGPLSSPVRMFGPFNPGCAVAAAATGQPAYFEGKALVPGAH